MTWVSDRVSIIDAGVELHRRNITVIRNGVPLSESTDHCKCQECRTERHDVLEKLSARYKELSCPAKNARIVEEIDFESKTILLPGTPEFEREFNRVFSSSPVRKREGTNFVNSDTFSKVWDNVTTEARNRRVFVIRLTKLRNLIEDILMIKVRYRYSDVFKEAEEGTQSSSNNRYYKAY